MPRMSADPTTRTWSSEAFVAEWVGQDVLADMLKLPRQISAALVADAGVDVTHVIDLGSGPGAYLQTLLESFPSARGTWVDTSPTMEEVARERLAHLDDRVEYRIGDIEALDSLHLGDADVVVTSRVVHHFSPESIQRFYAGVHEHLADGGFFFNLDHFGVPEPWEQRYRAIRRQFTGRPKQEVPRHHHDYPFSLIETHLGWLEQAGFAPPDVPWRTFFTALLAARRET
jgi:SAM-dependent methyltransferase